MSSLREKLEKVHSLLINEETEQAELLFHEAFVEAAREIHKKIMEEEDWLDEAGTCDTDEVADDMEESLDEDLVGEAGEEDAEMDAEDAEMDAEDAEMDAEDAEMDAEAGDEESVEDKIADLEAELEALKAEFEELQADEMDEPEHNDIFGDEDAEPEVDAEDGEMDEGIEHDKKVGAEKYGTLPGYDPKLTPGHPRNQIAISKATKKFESVDALDESFELESVSSENSESTVGSGKGFEPKLNKESPIPQKKVGDRVGGKPVTIKSKDHKGYDREDSPTTQQMEKRKNVRSRAEEDMSKMSKEGVASAAINKTESEFGKGNMKSPIGSKGTVQAKGLTESRKRKA